MKIKIENNVNCYTILDESASAKEEGKSEAEETQHKAKKAFKKEGWKAEINGTKAREEVRRLESEPRSVGRFVR